MLGHTLRRVQRQPSEAVYGVPGDYLFVVPSGVSSISMLCIGGGGEGASFVSLPDGQGNGGGGGGALSYSNSVAVTPGETLSIRVGTGSENTLKESSIINSGATVLVYARPGVRGTLNSGGAGALTTSPAVGDIKRGGGAGAAGSTTLPRGGGGGRVGTTSTTGSAGSQASVDERGGASGVSFILNATKNGYSTASTGTATKTGANAPNAGGGGGGGCISAAGAVGFSGDGGDGLVILLWGGRVFSSGTSF